LHVLLDKLLGSCRLHPKKQKPSADANWKAEQEKQRREQAIANLAGIHVLAAIASAVPVRLMKRDLLFVAERLALLLDENRLTTLARQHGIKKAKDSDSIGKLFAAYLRRAEESVLGRVIVELTIVLSASRNNTAQVLSDGAAIYKVDTEAIALEVKGEFAAKQKSNAEKKATTKAVPAKVKKSA
jgi:ParB family chromosome partitioning protein